MKPVEIKVRVLRIEPNNTIVMVPVVNFEKVNRHKETGRKLTDAQVKKTDAALVTTEQVLTENTKFWKKSPSANIRITPDQDHNFKVDETYTITITKAK